MEKYPFRAQMLAELEEYAAEGVIEKVEWLSAGDNAVCPECARRQGMVYTLAEAKQLLVDDYCHPQDREQNCRCVFLPVIGRRKS